MAERVRIAVIGAGRIGRLHARNLAHQLPAAELVAVADVVAEAARSLAAELGLSQAYSDPRRILDDPSIAAVVIASSTPSHAPLIADSAEAGKAIMCEKPIALDLPSIDRALEVVRRTGATLQVGFNRRFDPGFSRAREAIAAGRIGTPRLLHITSRDPEPPPIAYVEQSGGLFLDMAIHDFDMARFLMGDEVVEVHASGACLIDPAIGAAGDVDTAVITLRFAGGAIGAIDNSRQAAYGYDQRVEVLGPLGMVSVPNAGADPALLSDAEGVHGAPLPHFFTERYRQAYLDEMSAFLSAVRHGTPPPVTGEDGRLAVVIGHAATLSQREGRPVKVSEVSKA